jgi:uncharacterized protein YcbK (DUF882 family)
VNNNTSFMNMTSRRGFLAAGLAALPAIAGLPKNLFAAAAGPSVRALDLLHTHTGEKLSVEYFSSGTYLPDAMGEVERFLRDFRTGDIHAIDPHVLDILHGVRDLTGSTKPFQIISGYRSPRTNAMLRETGGGGVAQGSLHMQGKAVDIRLADVPLSKLRNAAVNLGKGGVGYYPGRSSNFVHVDTGRFRRW